MSYSYAGAWWVDSPEAVIALRTIGCDSFIIPAAVGDIRLDATLTAVQASENSIVLLDGPDTEKVRVVTRLVGRPTIRGYIPMDEPNIGGASGGADLATQRRYYTAIKTIDPGKAVFASYHIEPDGLSYPPHVEQARGLSWDYVFVNYYPVQWNVPVETQITNLVAAAQATQAYFGNTAWIIPLQQAAGCTTFTQGVLQPFYDLIDQWGIWQAAGCLAQSHALFYYGWGTSPEDHNLATDSRLRTSAAETIAHHRAFYA